MAKILSEAVQDQKSGKWGFYVNHETEGQLLEPIYVFESQREAEQKLLEVLKELGEIAKKP